MVAVLQCPQCNSHNSCLQTWEIPSHGVYVVPDAKCEVCGCDLNDLMDRYFEEKKIELLYRVKLFIRRMQIKYSYMFDRRP